MPGRRCQHDRRAFVVLAYPTQSHEMRFDAHTQSFTALGGIPRRGLYDHTKTAVDKVKKGKVSSTCLVIEDRNRYSVPCELAGQMVSIRIDPERIDFVAHDAVVASHPRSFERQQVRYDGQHYLPLIERKPGALRHGAPFADMPEARQRLRGLLLKREGGDRIMAKVLAAVPTSGLETVLVAVERVLESGNPSAEHVENVLNRLKAAPLPDAVETHLEMAEAPLADAGRYDRLREEVSHA